MSFPVEIHLSTHALGKTERVLWAHVPTLPRQGDKIDVSHYIEGDEKSDATTWRVEEVRFLVTDLQKPVQEGLPDSGFFELIQVICS